MKISSKLNELKPTDLNCNVFDVYSYDGLSMQDLLCQFFTKINECIKVSNETIDLASWLVNEGLEIEVVKKLMLWLEDGTLENLINVNLFNTLNTKIYNITSNIQTMFVYSNSNFQEIIDYCITNNIKQINVNEDIELSSGVNFKEFEGYVFGKGKIKAKPGVKISQLVNLSNSKNIKFEVNIDMGQNELTELNSDKCDIGIYVRNARNITLDNITYTNCRIGRPLYISGSSSCNPTNSDGSKNITVNNNKIFGIKYPVVDEGCYMVISSDFYTQGNGVYYSASNGLKKSDLTVDENVAYKPTTQNIFINNLYAENCDRIAILNVDKIFFNDCVLENFYTRGYNFSPTCTNFSVKGGYVNGGNATQLAVAYGCKNGSFENIKVTPNEISVGEKSTLKTYYGCNNINYTNISGIGNYDRSIYIKSVSDVTFDNVKLNRNDTTVKYGIEIICCDDDNNYTMKNIKFKNCMIEANTGLYIESMKSNGKIGLGGITFDNCDFNCSGEFIRTLSNMEALGFLVFKNLDVKYSTSANQIINSKNVLYYDKSNRGIIMNMSKQISTTTQTIMHYFDDLYYFVPKASVSGGEDNIRPVNVSLYKDGALLVYGVDWFCSGSMANEQMLNYIRLKDGTSVASGSKLTLVRHN